MRYGSGDKSSCQKKKSCQDCGGGKFLREGIDSVLPNMRTSNISRLPWDSTDIYSDSLFSWPRRRASMHWWKSAFKWVGTSLQRKFKSPLPSRQSPRASLMVFHLVVCPLPSLRMRGSLVRLDLRQARDWSAGSLCTYHMLQVSSLHIFSLTASVSL